MALKFLTDAEVGEAELVIELDFDGLQSWLRLAATALEARHDQSTQAGGGTAVDAETPARGAMNAFSKVTIRFVDTAGSDLGGRPDIGLAGGARGSGDTACWEVGRHGT
jgi:hypothetical protein